MKILDQNTHFLIFIDRDYWFSRNLDAVKAFPVTERRWWKEKNAWWVSGMMRNEVLALQISHRAELIANANEQIGEIEPLPMLEFEPPLKGIELREYQRNGIARCLQLKRLINGDDMGLGKTIQTIASIATAHQQGQNVFPALIICPSSLKENWKREIEKFTDHKAMILNDANKKSWDRYYEIGYAQFFIVNYESLKKFFITSVPTKKGYKSIEIGITPKAELFKSVVADESHRLKDTTTQQTKFTLRLAYRREWVFLLTGTPVVNKPLDLWSQICIMGHHNVFGPTLKQFKDRFCFSANNWKALNYLLNKNCYFRREKKDVAKELPPKSRQKILCEITNMEEYNHAYNHFVNWLTNQGFDDDKIASAMKAQVLVQMNVLRQISAKGKIDAAKEFIDEVIDSEKKVIVFCHHKVIVDALKAIYPHAGTVTGSDPMEARQRYVDAFQNDKKANIIICNFKSGGTGLTLTASSQVLSVEFPWTYADAAQAEDRANRIGQTEPVMATYLLGINTIDEMVLDLILAKNELATDIAGSTDQMEMSTIDKMMNLFNVKKATS